MFTIPSSKQTFKYLPEIILKEGLMTRLVFLPFVIEKGDEVLVRGHIYHQKKRKNDEWQEVKDIELSSMKAGEYVKIELDSGSIKKLLESSESLREFFQENGIRSGEIAVVRKSELEIVKGILGKSDKEGVIQLVIENDLIPADIVHGIEFARKKESIQEFGDMLQGNLLESSWQEWFQNKDNYWILGTEFVQVLDERKIDVENISDFLMKSYDGFLDIIEIKRPEGGLEFWASSEDHGNLVPHNHLVKAITQSLNYLYEIERESNSDKFYERVGGIKVVKPRITLIFGRSKDWGDKERKAYRILNSSYHNLSILSFDHVLERAEKILGYNYQSSVSRPSRTLSVARARPIAREVNSGIPF